MRIAILIILSAGLSACASINKPSTDKVQGNFDRIGTGLETVEQKLERIEALSR